MRYIIAIVSCLLAVVSCSRQNVESKEVEVQDSIVVGSKDTVVVELSINNNIKSDTVIRVSDGDSAISITDTFLLKDADRSVFDWLRIDIRSCLLNDWEYSENAEYVVTKVEWEDDSGCHGDSMFAYRNGIKIMKYSYDACGDMGGDKLECYYDNGIIGYEEREYGQFGGGFASNSKSVKEYSKDGKLIYEIDCSKNEVPVYNDSTKYDETSYTSILKRDGQEVTINRQDTTISWIIIYPDGGENTYNSDDYTSIDEAEKFAWPRIVYETMDQCKSIMNEYNLDQ